MILSHHELADAMRVRLHLPKDCLFEPRAACPDGGGPLCATIETTAPPEAGAVVVRRLAVATSRRLHFPGGLGGGCHAATYR